MGHVLWAARVDCSLEMKEVRWALDWPACLEALRRPAWNSFSTLHAVLAIGLRFTSTLSSSVSLLGFGRLSLSFAQSRYT